MNKKYIMITIISVLILSIGASFAYWTAKLRGEGTQMTFTSDELRIIFDNEGNSITSNTPIEPGWSITKTFSVKNESDTDYNYNIIIKDLINTFKTTGFLQYKITSNDGYNMTEYKDIPKSETAAKKVLTEEITLASNGTHEYTIEFRYIETDEDQSDDMGAMLQGTIFVEEFRIKTLYNQILADHPDVRTRVTGDFDSILGDSTGTSGVIYKESVYKEDGNDVYYFAGNVRDNWVEFAGKMWRIIRTNEDGGVRLLYHGTSTTATNAYIGTSAYNGTYNNTMYVGYMYGSTGSIGNNRTNGTSSGVKTKVDNWYRDNINSSYGNYVSQTAIYCNDRASGAYSSSGYMWYAAISRLGKKWQSMSGNQPSYQCGQNAAGGYFASGTGASSSSWTNSTAAYTSAAPNVADKFSKSTASGGNGKLTYPVGLMTADEVAFAGGIFPQNSPNTYYYLNSAGGSSTGTYWWWTMSPYYASSNGFAYMFGVYGSTDPGNLYFNGVYNSFAVRPVLSLKSCVVVSSGNGTAESPYKVELPSTCAAAEN